MATTQPVNMTSVQVSRVGTAIGHNLGTCWTRLVLMGTPVSFDEWAASMDVEEPEPCVSAGRVSAPDGSQWEWCSTHARWVQLADALVG